MLKTVTEKIPVRIDWTKNYGPYFIVDGNNEIGIVDFHYDRPERINDNAIPYQLANHWNYNYFDSDIIYFIQHYNRNYRYFVRTTLHQHHKRESRDASVGVTHR